MFFSEDKRNRTRQSSSTTTTTTTATTMSGVPDAGLIAALIAEYEANGRNLIAMQQKKPSERLLRAKERSRLDPKTVAFLWQLYETNQRSAFAPATANGGAATTTEDDNDTRWQTPLFIPKAMWRRAFYLPIGQQSAAQLAQFERDATAVDNGDVSDDDDDESMEMETGDRIPAKRYHAKGNKRVSLLDEAVAMQDAPEVARLPLDLLAVLFKMTRQVHDVASRKLPLASRFFKSLEEAYRLPASIFNVHGDAPPVSSFHFALIEMMRHIALEGRRERFPGRYVSHFADAGSFLLGHIPVASAPSVHLAHRHTATEASVDFVVHQVLIRKLHWPDPVAYLDMSGESRHPLLAFPALFNWLTQFDTTLPFPGPLVAAYRRGLSQKTTEVGVIRRQSYSTEYTGQQQGGFINDAHQWPGVNPRDHFKEDVALSMPTRHATSYILASYLDAALPLRVIDAMRPPPSNASGGSGGDVLVTSYRIGPRVAYEPGIPLSRQAEEYLEPQLVSHFIVFLPIGTTLAEEWSAERIGKITGSTRKLDRQARVFPALLHASAVVARWLSFMLEDLPASMRARIEHIYEISLAVDINRQRSDTVAGFHRARGSSGDRLSFTGAPGEGMPVIETRLWIGGQDFVPPPEFPFLVPVAVTLNLNKLAYFLHRAVESNLAYKLEAHFYILANRFRMMPI